MRASGTWAAPFSRVIGLSTFFACGRSPRRRREELVSEAGDQIVETPVSGRRTRADDRPRLPSRGAAPDRARRRTRARAHAVDNRPAASRASPAPAPDSRARHRSAGRPSRRGRPGSGSRRGPQRSDRRTRVLPRARDEPVTGSARPAARRPRRLTVRPSRAPRRSQARAAAARPTTRSSDRVSRRRRSARRSPRRSRRSRAKCRGRPVRGNAWKITVRADANPRSCPCQNGELADSASSIGILRRRPLSSRTASSASGTPTCTCRAIVGSRRREHAHPVADQRGSAPRRNLGLLRGRSVDAFPRRRRSARSRPTRARAGSAARQFRDDAIDVRVDARGELDHRRVSLRRRRAARACQRAARAALVVDWASDQPPGRAA